MGLNPKAPAWTPGPSSSGDRRGDSLGRIRRVVHGVGTHKSVDGAETLGVGGLNLPKKKDKHRANLHSQRVQQATSKLSACNVRIQSINQPSQEYVSTR